MRKKKNIEKKLESVADVLITPKITDPNYATAVNVKEYFDFRSMFGNGNPVELEVGCGKGQFICNLAQMNPDRNYLAVEVNPNVMYMACKRASDNSLTNVRFVRCLAEFLPKYIPDNSVERIYLNFSCPFPKKKYACHRLTNPRFLKMYRCFLTENGEIHQKTDNMKLFEYSIEQLSQCGFALKNVSLDLHNSNFNGNIVTEYEKKFTDLGLPIYRLEAYVPTNL